MEQRKAIAESLLAHLHKEIGMDRGAMHRWRLRVCVHRAYFVGSGQECFFVNLTNRSSRRDLE